MNIDDYVVVEEVFVKDRWHVVLDEALNGRRRIPKANYVWLKGNPAFEDIPPEYVIHHLDHDPLNDDISNLALMYKHHHVGHHWKSKRANPEKIKPKISFDKKVAGRVLFFPEAEPSIHKRSDRGTYILCFSERIDGVRKRRTLNSYDGKTFKTKRQAEKAKGLIWQKDSGIHVVDAQTHG